MAETIPKAQQVIDELRADVKSPEDELYLNGEQAEVIRERNRILGSKPLDLLKIDGSGNVIVDADGDGHSQVYENGRR